MKLQKSYLENIFIIWLKRCVAEIADFPRYCDPEQPAVYRNSFFPTNMGELSSEIRKKAKRKLGSRVPQRMFRKKNQGKVQTKQECISFSTVPSC